MTIGVLRFSRYRASLWLVMSRKKSALVLKKPLEITHPLVKDGSRFLAPGGRLEAVPGNVAQHGSKRVLGAASASDRASAHLDP